MRTNTTLRLWVLAVATVVIAVACDRVNLTAPTGSSISVTVERSVLPLGGQTTVTAVVTESAGTPVHNGTYVTFQTTVGAFNPPEAQTQNGVARTMFLAGSNSGTATIHAFSGGARTGSGNASSGGATIKIGAAAAAGTISMSASPTSVSQSGGTVTITAQVFDADNNPLPGVNVQFVTGTGSLNPTTATTDANGVARTQLTTTQTSVVDAVAGAAKGNVSVAVATAPSLQIEPTVPLSPVAGQPVGITVTTSSGTTTAPRQVQTLDVNFGDGTSETRSNVTGSSSFTHTYGRAGGYTISARAVDVAGNTAVASRAIIVGNPSLPTVTATMTDETPQVNQIIGFTITGTPGTNGGLPIESVRAFINGELVFSGSGSSGAFTKGFSGTGTYLLTAEAVDAAGNVGRTQKFFDVAP